MIPAHELRAQNAALRTALDAMLDVQSRRRHPLGAPDEGIGYDAAAAASLARAALSLPQVPLSTEERARLAWQHVRMGVAWLLLLQPRRAATRLRAVYRIWRWRAGL